MKKTHMFAAAALLFITLQAFAQSREPPAQKLRWDWLEMAYEIGYDVLSSEEAREKSAWAGRANLNVGIFSNLHSTASYDKQDFDTAFEGTHSHKNIFLGRYGLGTHINLGAMSALVFEVTRQELGQKTHYEDFSGTGDSYAVLRGFGYYAGLRQQLGNAELALGYERADFKDDIGYEDGADPIRVKIKLNTLSMQLLAPLSRRISVSMRFEQRAARSKVDQNDIDLHYDDKVHAENLLFGLRFSL